MYVYVNRELSHISRLIILYLSRRLRLCTHSINIVTITEKNNTKQKRNYMYITRHRQRTRDFAPRDRKRERYITQS